MEIWYELLETAIDCLKMLPFLFGAYLLIEYIEQFHSVKLQRALSGNSHFGFAVGSALGLVPQCGFSAMASELFSSRIITPGTLIAVFLSTSDEALPLMLATGNVRDIIILLDIKFGIALISGFTVDRIAHLRWGGFSGRQEDIDCHDHREEEKVLPAALRHTLHIFCLVFILSAILAIAMELVGKDIIRNLLQDMGIWQVPLTALVGLVPNCAVSVLLMELYSENLLTFGSLVAGLSSGAGVGLIVLWRTNPDKKQNLRLTFVLYLCAVVFGLLLTILM